MKQQKYDYLIVLQGNYGGGWEDIDAHLKTDYKKALTNLKAYRKNAPEYSYRIIRRRELRENVAATN